MTAPAAARVGRDGALRLRFERRGARTVVAGCRSTLPLQVLAPVALPGPAAVISILAPTGGLVGGDRLVVDVAVGPGAHACLTTPSATKVYRTLGAPATQTVRLAIGPGAILEWVPDHTIPFPGSAYVQDVDVDLADDGTLILVDAWAAGRVARDEAWRFARLASALRVRDPAGWVLWDRWALDPGGSDAIGLAEGFPYFASVVVVGRGIEAFEAGVAAALPARSDVAAGVARLARRGAVVRCLARAAPALGEALDAVWASARRAVLGLPPLALRKP